MVNLESKHKIFVFGDETNQTSTTIMLTLFKTIYMYFFLLLLFFHWVFFTLNRRLRLRVNLRMVVLQLSRWKVCCKSQTINISGWAIFTPTFWLDIWGLFYQRKFYCRYMVVRPFFRPPRLCYPSGGQPETFGYYKKFLELQN